MVGGGADGTRAVELAEPEVDALLRLRSGVGKTAPTDVPGRFARASASAGFAKFENMPI